MIVEGFFEITDEESNKLWASWYTKMIEAGKIIDESNREYYVKSIWYNRNECQGLEIVDAEK